MLTTRLIAQEIGTLLSVLGTGLTAGGGGAVSKVSDYLNRQTMCRFS